MLTERLGKEMVYILISFWEKKLSKKVLGFGLFERFGRFERFGARILFCENPLEIVLRSISLFIITKLKLWLSFFAFENFFIFFLKDFVSPQ